MPAMYTALEVKLLKPNLSLLPLPSFPFPRRSLRPNIAPISSQWY